MKWINCDDELPSEDGFYEVTNSVDPNHNLPLNEIVYCIYDGFGFLYNHIYRNFCYWRCVKGIEKKYGKQYGKQK